MPGSVAHVLFIIPFSTWYISSLFDQSRVYVSPVPASWQWNHIQFWCGSVI